MKSVLSILLFATTSVAFAVCDDVELAKNWSDGGSGSVTFSGSCSYVSKGPSFQSDGRYTVTSKLTGPADHKSGKFALTIDKASSSSGPQVGSYECAGTQDRTDKMEEKTVTKTKTVWEWVEDEKGGESKIEVERTYDDTVKVKVGDVYNLSIRCSHDALACASSPRNRSYSIVMKSRSGWETSPPLSFRRFFA